MRQVVGGEARTPPRPARALPAGSVARGLVCEPTMKQPSKEDLARLREDGARAHYQRLRDRDRRVRDFIKGEYELCDEWDVMNAIGAWFTFADVLELQVS